MIKQNNINDNQNEVLILKRTCAYEAWQDDDDKIHIKDTSCSWQDFVTNKKLTKKEFNNLLEEGYTVVDCNTTKIMDVNYPNNYCIVRETIFLKKTK